MVIYTGSTENVQRNVTFPPWWLPFQMRKHL